MRPCVAPPQPGSSLPCAERMQRAAASLVSSSARRASALTHAGRELVAVGALQRTGGLTVAPVAVASVHRHPAASVAAVGRASSFLPPAAAAASHRRASTTTPAAASVDAPAADAQAAAAARAAAKAGGKPADVVAAATSIELPTSDESESLLRIRHSVSL